MSKRSERIINTGLGEAPCAEPVIGAGLPGTASLRCVAGGEYR